MLKKLWSSRTERVRGSSAEIFDDHRSGKKRCDHRGKDNPIFIRIENHVASDVEPVGLVRIGHARGNHSQHGENAWRSGPDRRPSISHTVHVPIQISLGRDKRINCQSCVANHPWLSK